MRETMGCFMKGAKFDGSFSVIKINHLKEKTCQLSLFYIRASLSLSLSLSRFC